MGTVTRLRPAPEITAEAAVAAYMATLHGAESAGTRRVYGGILARLAARYAGQDPAAVDPGELAAWVTATWGERSPARWNTVVDTLAAASRYWEAQGWVAASPAGRLRRRRPAPDRDRALSRERVEELIRRENVGLREKLLWRMLYETAARSAEILRLDVPDLDLANRCARVTRKGGAADVIVWQTGTAILLSRYLKGRTAGPLFLTSRRARVELPRGDTDPATGRARLGYERARQMFAEASGGATLHQLRHAALSHALEDGASTPILMARSGHMSVRSLVRYARVSPEALRAHMQATDPARRR